LLKLEIYPEDVLEAVYNAHGYFGYARRMTVHDRLEVADNLVEQQR
jgi:hypothetical protein